MVNHRETLTIAVNAELIAEIRDLAESEGRQIQSVVEDALRSYLVSGNKGQGREHVMAAYQKSTERFVGLYEKLAK